MVRDNEVILLNTDGDKVQIIELCRGVDAYVPDYAVHNGHMFYVRVKDLKTRTDLIRYMKEKGVLCVFHYIPLHSAPAGKQYGTFHGEDVYTTKESECLMRLPMYYSLSMDDVKYVTDCLLEYYGE